MKSILILGSTGSIGTQALEVLKNCPKRFRVEGLVAHKSAEKAVQQALAFQAKFLVITNEKAAVQAEKLLRGTSVQLLRGRSGLNTLLDEANYDLALHAISGAAGLLASLKILQRGKTLALANKESLVLAGNLIKTLLQQFGGSLIPVDSEHCAIFQCLQQKNPAPIRKVYLTGSGGPFRTRPLDEFDSITPQEALCHPNWSMGPRITVDSATMMNKVLEVIEAHYLFNLTAEQIEVVIHPQSIIHSMVEFADGTLLAQLSQPSMKIPIHYALSYPQGGNFAERAFDWEKFSQLTLEQPDPKRYPAIKLAYECLKVGGLAGAVLNAADEVSTQMFLDGHIRFPEIVRTNAQVLKEHQPIPDPDIDQILAADAWARQRARKYLEVAQ